MKNSLNRTKCSLSPYASLMLALVSFLGILGPSSMSAQCVTGQTGGTVWIDYNGDGIKDAGETNGLANVTVTAYDCMGNLLTTVTTNAAGQYTLGTISTFPIRVEFSNVPAPYLSTFNGTDGRTDAQVVTAAECNVDFGVNNPADYCQANALLVTPCYVNGEALGGTTAGARDGFVGVANNFTGNGLSSDNSYLADVEKIGATWGVAVQASTKTIFTTSVMKRQVSFGPANNTPGTTTHTTGGIYAINYTNIGVPTSSLWLDVNTLSGVNTGADPHSGLSGDPAVQNRDAAAFDDVGKIALGDIDISEDGTKLYVVNLNQKTLLEIDIATKALLNTYTIPNPGCTDSDNTVTQTLHFSNTTGSFTGNGSTFTDGRTTLAGETGSITNNGAVDFNPTDAPMAMFVNPAFGNNMSLSFAGNGTYEVNLYFRDYSNAVGARIFDISLEGTVVKNDFDIIADNNAKWSFLNLNSSGGNNGNFSSFGWIANQQTFTVTVTDGTLNINLDRVSGFAAIISGVRIRNLGTTPTVVNNFRPWGLGVKGNKVYVGGVCSGEASGLRQDISATVYELSGGVFTSVLSFDLDHERAFATRGPSAAEQPAMWMAWDDDNTYNTWDFKSNGSSWIEPAHHQPILSDITFDNAGNMLLGMIDRMAMQVGYESITPTRASGILEYGYSAGDMLKACASGATWIIEGSSAACPQPFVGATTHEDHIGINGGEFFGRDQILFTNSNAHDEIAFGGLAYNKSFDHLITTCFDPKGNVNTGGYAWYNNATGGSVKSYEIYSASAIGTFGKAVGLGDIEYACNPAPLQIGNYVWIDADKDGTQDPCELPLPGVIVSLYNKTTGTYLAKTTTGSNGEYYFTGLGASGETWVATSGLDSIQANTQYTIVFGYDGAAASSQYSTTSQFLTVSSTNYALTAPDSGEGTAASPDQNDSDAAAMAVAGQPYTNYPMIMYTTGAVGSVNHTLDAGFIVCPSITTPSATQNICLGNAGSNITVETNQNAANSIRFVRFTTDQTAINGSETSLEITAIYAGTTVATVTPTGASNPYTATLTAAAAGWSALPAGTYYIYAIYTPDQGAPCQPVQEIRVNINPVPTVAAASNTPVCAGSNISLTATFTAAGTSTSATIWSWSGPDGFTSAVEDPTVFAATAAKAGTYTVQVTDNNGCTNTATTSVVVGIAPTVAAASNTPVCAGSNISLTATFTAAGTSTSAATWSWSGPDGFTSAMEDPTAFAATAAKAGTYTVQVTDNNGCTNTATTTVAVVTPPAAPTVTIIDNTCSPVAAGSISVSACGAGFTTEYSTNGGTNWSTTAPAYPTAPTQITVIARCVSTTLATCVSPNSAPATTVAIVCAPCTPPTVSAASNTPVCTGSNISLTATFTASGTSTSATTWSWSGPDGFTSAVEDPTAFAATAAKAGTYTVQVTDNNGCTNTATTTVVVNPIPTVAAASSTPVCEGSNISLTATFTAAGTSSSAATWSWSGPDGFTSAMEDPTAFAATAAKAGTYTVQVTDNNGCTNTATTTVAVVTPPAAPTVTIIDNTCSPVAAGSISVSACGAGFTTEYSTNGGINWSTTAPAYPTAPTQITVIARCVSTTLATCVSPNSAPAPTVAITCPCTPPTATFIKAPGNCTGITPNDNGAILIATTTGTPDRYGIVPGATYTGVNYAGATAIGTLPFVAQAGVSNSGGTYTVRVFAGSDACFADYTVTVPPATCPSDPMGYIYNEATGMIVPGGTITVTNVPAGGSVFIAFDGSSGYYQFYTNGVAGDYTFAYTPPAGYMLSTTTLPGASYNPDPALPNPDVLGADDADTNGFLDNFTGASNPYYFSFTFDAGDPDILLNNIPIKESCVTPTLTVSDGVVCSGGSIDLSTLATGTGGTITYHATYADAVAGTPTLGATVSPTGATNYYVRNASSATCYTIKEIVVRISAPTCGTIQVAGPN